MAFTNKFELTLNKTAIVNGKNKYVEVGKASIPFPVLADFGITAEQEKDDKGQLVVIEGIPQYSDPKMDFLMGAVVSAVAAKARNRYKDGVLKPGLTIAEDFEALLADSVRTGDALALRREARVDFENYLRSLSKKDTVVAALGDLFWNSSKVIPVLQPDSQHLKAIKLYVTRWVDQLDEARATRFAPKLVEISESIDSVGKEEDLLGEDAEAAA